MWAVLRRLIASARDANSGSVATIFAVALPAMVIASLGGVDITSVITDRAKMQEIADNTALSAAKQLAIDPSDNTAARAKSLAGIGLATLMEKWSLDVKAAVVNDGKGVQVTITGKRPSFFENLLPPGGWKVHLTAQAQIEGLMPLCVLATGSTSGGLGGLLGNKTVIDQANMSKVTAPACMVYANNSIAVRNSAQMNAGAIEASGDAKGTISPAPQSGAPAVADPFASIPLTVPSLCTTLSLTLVTGTTELAPGVHCGVLIVMNKATLKLLPGEHYFFAAVLTLAGNATLSGTDVALVFDGTSKFLFTQQSDIELEGRKSGSLAGFVIATVRGNVETFTISTTAAHKLLGVVYIPDGNLSVSGSSKVAESSAWTVIVAKSMNVAGSADLNVNADYAGTTVPVPKGVGPSAADSTVRLIE